MRGPEARIPQHWSNWCERRRPNVNENSSAGAGAGGDHAPARRTGQLRRRRGDGGALRGGRGGRLPSGAGHRGAGSHPIPLRGDGGGWGPHGARGGLARREERRPGSHGHPAARWRRIRRSRSPASRRMAAGYGSSTCPSPRFSRPRGDRAVRYRQAGVGTRPALLRGAPEPASRRGVLACFHPARRPALPKLRVAELNVERAQPVRGSSRQLGFTAFGATVANPSAAPRR